MVGSLKLNEEKQRELQQIVAVEIEQYRRNQLERLTTNSELAKEFGISIKTIINYLRKLIPEEDISYRSRSMRQKLKLRYQIDLQQIVAVELEQYKRDEIERFTSNSELSKEFGLDVSTVIDYLRILIPDEDIRYRSGSIGARSNFERNYPKGEISEIERRDLWRIKREEFERRLALSRQ
jgi:predicted transcriptional regulator